MRVMCQTLLILSFMAQGCAVQAQGVVSNALRSAPDVLANDTVASTVVRPTYIGTPALTQSGPPMARPQMGAAAVSGVSASALPSPSQQGTGAGFLHHLPNNIQGFRLSGEIAASEWPIYVTQAQTRQHLRFQIGYIAAVSVMPESSKLVLRINDQIVGEAAINAVNNVKIVSFDIPDHLVRPGFNAVRLEAEQRHRVDCSLQATYELWTQIDPSQTGLVLTQPDVGVNNLSDLAALPLDEQGALPIRLLIPGRTSQSAIERVLRAVSLISLTGRFDQPSVDVGALADGDYGINLAVGPANEILQQTGLTIGPVSGPRIVIMPAAAGRRTTIVVTGVNDEQVNTALNQFTVAMQKSGTDAGLRAAAAFPGYRLVGGQRVRLHDLGVNTAEFSGRLFRTAFNIMMPADFFAADYDRLTLSMAGGYAANLTNAAQVVINVNGRNAVSLKLPKSSGDVFADNQVPLPLGYMHPGLNRIEIEAHVPKASDAVCDPLAMGNDGKRFLLLDSTELSVPPIAQIARMPDLAVMATGGFPYVSQGMNNGGRPKMYVPAPDRESIGSAATIAAHLSISAGSVIDFALTTVAPAPGSGAVLVVGPATAIDKSILTGVGLVVDDVTKAWSEKFTPVAVADTDVQLSRFEDIARKRLGLQRNFPASCHIGRPPKGFGRFAAKLDRLATGAIPEDGPDSVLFSQWDTSLRSQNRLRLAVVHGYQAVTGWFHAKFFDATLWVSDRFEETDAKSILNTKSSLVMAQALMGTNGTDVWTVVTAPTAALLAESVECLVDPRVWGQVAGRMSVLDADEGTVKNAPVKQANLIATQPPSLGNLRLIAAAWLSLNSAIYVALALLMAVVLAAASHLFITNVGRRSE